jgi:hypothetical protein
MNASGSPLPTCGKPGCRPMEHAGWDLSKASMTKTDENRHLRSIP